MNLVDALLNGWEKARLRMTRRRTFGRYRELPAYFEPEWTGGDDPRLHEALEAIHADLGAWMDPGPVEAPPIAAIGREGDLLRFPSPAPSGHPAVDRVALKVYPAPEGAPEVGVLFHHWVYFDRWEHADFFVAPLLGRYRVAAMCAPHHLDRKRPGWLPGEGVMNPNPLRLYEAFRQWQADHAACMGILAREHGFRRVVVLGYSMGGYNTLLWSLFRPAPSAVLVNVTNNYARGVLEGPVTGRLRIALAEAGFPPERFRRAVRSLHIASHADRIDTSRFTWMRARADRVEPLDSLVEAAERLRCERTVVLPGGHATAVFFRKRIAREVARRIELEAKAI